MFLLPTSLLAELTLLLVTSIALGYLGFILVLAVYPVFFKSSLLPQDFYTDLHSYCWLRVLPEDWHAEALDRFGYVREVNYNALLQYISDKKAACAPGSAAYAEAHAVRRAAFKLCLSQDLPAQGYAVHSSIATLASGLSNSIHADGISQVVAGNLLAKRKKALEGSAQVPPTLVPVLLEAGVLCSSDDVADHCHGAHKAIELHFYGNVIPGYATIPTTVATQKQAKFERMRRANPNFVTLANPRFDEEDEKRYAGTPVLDLENIVTPALLFADSGHHVTRAEAGAIFRANPLLSKIFLVGVMPGETLSGHSSVHPYLYRIKYDEDGEGFDYMLEGTTQGFYRHKQRPWMLRPGVQEVAFEDGHCVQFTVQPLTSVFAHTIVALTRGVEKTKVRPRYHQDAKDLVEIPDVFLERLDFPVRRGKPLVPAKLLRELVNYMPTLKNKDALESMSAKIRSNFNVPAYNAIPADVWSQLLLVSWEMSRELNRPVFTGKLHLTSLDVFIRSLSVRCLELVQENKVALALSIWSCVTGLAAPWVRLPNLMVYCANKYVNREAWSVADALAIGVQLFGPIAGLASLASLLGVAAYEWRRTQHQIRAKRVLSILASSFSIDLQARNEATLPSERAHILAYTDDEVMQLDTDAKFTVTAICCGAPTEICMDCAPKMRRAAEALRTLLEERAEAVLSAQPSRRSAAAESPAEIGEAMIQVGTRELVSKPLSRATIAENSGEFDASSEFSSRPGTPADEQKVHPSVAAAEPTSLLRKYIEERPELLLTDADREVLHALAPSPSPSDKSIAHRNTEANKITLTFGSIAPETATAPEASIITLSRDSRNPFAADPLAAPEGIPNKQRQGVSAAEEENKIRAVYPDPTPTELPPAAARPATPESRVVPAFFREQRGEPAETKVSELFTPERSEHYDARLAMAQLSRGFASLSKLIASDPRLHHCHNAPWLVCLSGPRAAVPYIETDSCGVVAAATHLGYPPARLWAAICTVVPARQMLDWQQEGCDERWFHVVGFYLKATFVLTGTKLASEQEFGMLLVGCKGKKSQHIAFTSDPAHWEASDISPTSLSKPICSKPEAVHRPPPGTFGSFLQRMEQFTSTHGARIPGSWNEYTAKQSRCDMLASEYNEGVAGGIRNLEGKRYIREFTKRLKFTADIVKEKKIYVRVCSGFAGCGKSDPVQQFLKGEEKAGISGEWVVGVPRLPLRQDWKDKVQCKVGYLLNTFENLFIRSGQMVVTDEHGLLLPGFLDFVALTTGATHFLVLGDETQCRAHNPNPESSLANLEPEMSWLSRHTGGEYWLWTHRSPQWLADFLGVQSTNPVQGAWRFTDVINPLDPIVVPDDFNKRKYGNASLKSYTFSGIQGQTHEHIQILCDRTSLKVTGAQDFVQAMTRSTNLVSFIIEDTSLLRLVRSHPVLSRLASGSRWDFRSEMGHVLKKYDVKYLAAEEVNSIRNKRAAAMAKESKGPRSFGTQAHTHASILKSLTRGKAYPTRPIDKVGPQAQVWFTGADYEEGLSVGMSIPTGRLESSEMHTHIPTMRVDAFMSLYLEPYYERMERELINERGASNCFPDNVELPHVLAMFPRQHASDEAFVKATYEKRLVHRSHEENERDLITNSSINTGFMLFNVARLALGLPEEAPWDERLFHECILAQEHSRVNGRSAKVLENNDGRADPDTDANFVQHWIKGQVKKKMECLNLMKAKAGQTLATCHESIIHAFGPHFRYMIEQVKRHTRPSIWLHHGKNLKEFDEWCREHWAQDRRLPKRGTINDFSNFDLTQVSESVLMECHFMRWSGTPEHVIEYYAWWKTHIRSSVIGQKRTGRDTGEPNTFGGNTLYSVGNTALKYGWEALTKGAWCFGGDDMACDYECTETEGWTTYWSKVIKTESKTFVVSEVDFCGYILTREGILRDPFVMLLKAIYTSAVGDLKLSLSGYAMELSFTYAKGDLLYDLLDDGAMAAFGVFLDIVHKQAPTTASYYFSTNVDLMQVARDAIARILSGKSMKGRKTELAGWQRVLTRGRYLRPLPRAASSEELYVCRLSSSLSIIANMSQIPTPSSSKDASSGGPASSGFAKSLLEALGIARVSSAQSPGSNHLVDPGAAEVLSALANSVAAPVSIIGQSWNPNLRPFEVIGTSLVPHEEISPGGTTEGIITWDPNGSTIIKDFTEFNPVAYLRGLRVRIVFTPRMAGHVVTVVTALCPSGAVPATLSSVLRLGSAQRVFCSPVASAFLPPAVEREFIVESYGVSSQFKPAPLLGGTPILVIYFKTVFAKTTPATEMIADLNISAVVERA